MFVPHSIHRRIAGLVLLFALTALLSVTLMMPNSIDAQGIGFLGDAENFAVLAGTTVTNTGSTDVRGWLGVSPGTDVTGSPQVFGQTHAGDAVALQGQNAVITAYDALAAPACDANLAVELGGTTLTPGVYCLGEAGLTGTLTLDAQGNPDAVFIFRMTSTLITASGSLVSLIGNANQCNIWWRVESSATLGTNSSFTGNILALTSIALTTGADVAGRALARNGAVTMDNNTVDTLACLAVQPTPGLSLTKDDGGVTAAPGDTISYTLNYQNTGNVDLTSVTLTDTIPADTTFNAGASTPGWNCGVNPCTFDLGTLLPGATGSAVFAVVVNNPTGVAQISNSASITSGATSATATDTTPVNQPPVVPPAVPTTAPPGATAVPPLVFTAVPTASATPGSGAGNSSNAQRAVSGLPNTGGGPPQPTYWMREPRR